tara:strand:+ start:86 stop:385 length:300 start_codon:yes stop_codon:yes gene_type:complete
MGTKVHKDARDEGTPQWRHMIEKERVLEKKRKHRYSGKKIGKKLPDGTYVEISTPDCDWHHRWVNPEMKEVLEELEEERLRAYRAKKEAEALARMQGTT